MAITHDYTISLENEKRGSRTFGMNPRPHRGGPGVGLGGRPRDQRGGGPRGPDGGSQPQADRRVGGGFRNRHLKNWARNRVYLRF